MDRVFANFFRRRREALPASTANTNQPQVTGATFEEKIVRVGRPELALSVSAVYRAVELRAKTEAQFSIQYQKMNAAGGNYVPDMWGPGKNINYLLQVQPNPISTAASLIEQVVIRRLLLGNAFVYIERDEWQDPVNLWLAECGGYNELTGMYSITYLGENGVRFKVDAPRKDVLHFANTFRYQDGFWGISTIKYAYDTLSLIKTESSQVLETAAKGGRVKGIISEKQPSNGQGTLAFGVLNPDQVQKTAKEMQDKFYSGMDIVGMHGLESFQSISMTAQDMQLLEHMNMGLDDVARFFGTPRPLLMLDTNSHYTTPTNATLEYMQRTVQPDIIEIEQEMNRKLLFRQDYGQRRIHMCEQPLLRLDKEAQAKVDQLQLQTGAATVNEIRAQYDRPSVEGGDTIYVSTNLAELGSEKLRGSQGKDSGIQEVPATNSEGGTNPKMETETE
jgi:HK97 family phage portal protein